MPMLGSQILRKRHGAEALNPRRVDEHVKLLKDLEVNLGKVHDVAVNANMLNPDTVENEGVAHWWGRWWWPHLHLVSSLRLSPDTHERLQSGKQLGDDRRP